MVKLDSKNFFLIVKIKEKGLSIHFVYNEYALLEIESF